MSIPEPDGSLLEILCDNLKLFYNPNTVLGQKFLEIMDEKNVTKIKKDNLDFYI